MQGGAIITGDYRYLLWREWNSSSKTVSFVMLNPSRADAQINDPTITRCINFALSWGYGRLEVVNLFAYRTSKPSLLKQAAEPIGEDNDRYIIESVRKSDAYGYAPQIALSQPGAIMALGDNRICMCLSY